MEQDIRYQGMSPVGDDYNSADGQMNYAYNLEMRDGAYHAARIPMDYDFYIEDFTPLFIHNPSNDGQTDDVVIGVYNDDEDTYSLQAYYYTESAGNHTKVAINADSLIVESKDSFGNFCAFGNIVMFTFNGEIKYLYYDDGEYKYLDRLPPFINLYFAAARPGENVLIFKIPADPLNKTKKTVVDVALPSNFWLKYPHAHLVSTDSKKQEIPKETQQYDEYTCPPESYFTQIDDKASDQVFAKLNYQIAQFKSIGYFVFPVIVRYAIRLYNGEHVQLSPPILVYPVEDPVVLSTAGDSAHEFNGLTYEGKYPTYKESEYTNSVYVFHDSYKLVFKLSEETVNTIKKLGKYGSLVNGIDVYISKDIYTVRTDHVVSRLTEQADGTYKYIPSFIKTRLYEKADEIADFYKVKSYTISEMLQWSADTYIDLLDSEDYGKLTTIEQQETLDSSSYANSLINATGLSVLNSRLNAYGVTKMLPQMFDLDIMCPPILAICPADTSKHKKGEYVLFECEDDFDDNEGYFFPYCLMKQYSLLTSTKEYVGLYRSVLDRNIRSTNYDDPEVTTKYGMLLKNSNGTNSEFLSQQLKVKETERRYLPLYYSYPATGGTKFCFYGKNYDKKTTEGTILMEDSEVMTISKYFFKSADDMKLNQWDEEKDTFPANKNQFITYPNLIKESEVNAPFIFKDGNSATCGNGRILAVGTNAQPVSQGQFGAYPIYAFCTDGVYAISIGSDGTLQGCSPFSQDIIVGSNALTQITREIAFTTASGIYMIGGGERQLLLPLDDTYDFNTGNTAIWTPVATHMSNMNQTFATPIALKRYVTDEQTRMAFDYAHSRLLVFNPQYAYSFSLSLSERAWSVIGGHQGAGNLSIPMNASDRCLIVDSSNYMWNFSTDENITPLIGFALSRSIKLGAPDVLKTIQSVIQRGVFEHGNVQQMFWGSRDNIYWTPISSSVTQYLRGFRGRPYKYFRLGIFTIEFEMTESLSGASVQFDARQTDLLR